MGDFGELALVIGDFHIPHRATSIPEKFQRMLVPNKMQHVLCTGNLSTKEQYDELRSLAPNVHVVRGSFDDNSSFPDTKVVQIGQFKVGLISGHQVLPWGDQQSLAMVVTNLHIYIDICICSLKHEVQRKSSFNDESTKVCIRLQIVKLLVLSIVASTNSKQSIYHCPT
jgi:vacuolar protein sorting-associated protein 29